MLMFKFHETCDKLLFSFLWDEQCESEMSRLSQGRRVLSDPRMLIDWFQKKKNPPFTYSEREINAMNSRSFTLTGPLVPAVNHGGYWHITETWLKGF